MTRLQIIQEALNLANRTDLLSEARLWLNMFLDGQYRNQDWPFAMKTASLAVTQGATIPTDYLRARSADIINGSNRLPVLFLTPEQYDFDRQSSINPSIPRKVYVDQYARTFNWVPAPSEVFTMELRYYFLPVLPDPYTPIGDSETPLWAVDDDILIQAVYVKALQFDDDARFDKESARLDDMIKKAKINSPDFRASTNRIKLGKSFRRRL